MSNSIFNLDELHHKHRYTKAESAWFFSSRDARFELSNMAGKMPLYAGLSTEGLRWGSSEALYQACKYAPDATCLPPGKVETPGYPANVRERIRSMSSPFGAKATQKCAVKAGLVRPDWADPEQEIRIHAMLWVVELKAYHNPRFRAVLRDTGDRPIVELSSKSAFWGTMLVEPDGHVMVGCNVLGKLLNHVRHRLMAIEAGELSCPKGFLL
ncbi:MAG: NADAR family protein [Myxococcota bacterium]